MATSRTIFTGLNKDNWEAGLRWVRTVKQSEVKLLVINMGLETDHVTKLAELGVEVLPNTNKTGIPQVDIFNSLVTQVKDNQFQPGVFLFWDLEAQAEVYSALWGSSLLCAPLLKDVNIASLVFPLTAIGSRVKIAARLETEVIEKYGSGFYAGLIAGRLSEWKLFTGLYNNLVETGVVETLIPARNLVLNLFALYFSDLIESKPVEYQISALQSENQE